MFDGLEYSNVKFIPSNIKPNHAFLLECREYGGPGKEMLLSLCRFRWILLHPEHGAEYMIPQLGTYTIAPVTF
jgi:hypothetical protein